jgi:hypothetical protein
VSTTTAESDRSHVLSTAEEEVRRALALLRDDPTGGVTIAALRAGGVKAPGQVVYDLQLAGFAIDRVSKIAPDGRRALCYRLRDPVSQTNRGMPSGAEDDA